MLLDELLMQHDRERQIADAELAHEVYLGHFRARWRAPRCQACCQSYRYQCSAINHLRRPPSLVLFGQSTAVLSLKRTIGPLLAARHTSVWARLLVLRLLCAESMKRHRYGHVSRGSTVSSTPERLQRCTTVRRLRAAQPWPAQKWQRSHSRTSLASVMILTTSLQTGRSRLRSHQRVQISCTQSAS